MRSPSRRKATGKSECGDFAAKSGDLKLSVPQMRMDRHPGILGLLPTRAELVDLLWPEFRIVHLTSSTPGLCYF